MLDKHLEDLPPVRLEHDFPKNKAIIEHYLRWKHAIASFMSKGMNTFSIQFPWFVRSPFGTVSSTSSYEELNDHITVNLEIMREGGIGICKPRTKIYLTVDQAAIVSQSGVVTMIVRDEGGQCVMLQIFNMKGVKTTVQGLPQFPVGSRFCLKNPFLKLGQDSWPLLRVDQPFDFQRLDIPPLEGSILVLGDGDFSFSVALAKDNKSRGRAHITATSLDSRKSVESTYGKGICQRYAKIDALLSTTELIQQLLTRTPNCKSMTALFGIFRTQQKKGRFQVVKGGISRYIPVGGKEIPQAFGTHIRLFGEASGGHDT
jgi:hypothetical protein